MAAGDYIIGVRDTIGALAAATHVGLAPSTVVSNPIPPSNGVGGPMGRVVKYKELAVTIYGNDLAELLALVVAAAADVVVPTFGLDGAAETITIVGVYFDEVVQDFEFPAPDAGGKVPQFAVRGRANWADGDTFADVLTAA